MKENNNNNCILILHSQHNAFCDCKGVTLLIKIQKFLQVIRKLNRSNVRHSLVNDIIWIDCNKLRKKNDNKSYLKNISKHGMNFKWVTRVYEWNDLIGAALKSMLNFYKEFHLRFHCESQLFYVPKARIKKLLGVRDSF